MMYKEIRQSLIPCLSFMNNTDDIMYVGPKLDLQQLRKLQERADSSLMYLPEIVEGMSKEAFEYNFPGVAWPGNISVDKIYDRIRTELAGSQNAAFSPEDMLVLRFEGDTLVVFNAKDDFAVLISYVINKCRRHLYGDDFLRYSISPDTLVDDMFIPLPDMAPICEEGCLCASICEAPVETADVSFDEQMEEAADEVREAIKRLLLKGFSASVIRSWLEEDVKLSRLRITRRFKILLVDYDKEVKMGPLPKTVFLFFLRHPEGIMFSHLMDYTDELLHIYSQVCRNDDPEKMHESVGRLTDPFDNSINEKCAAVKKAFMLQIEDSIARNYYICGQQGFKKGISLDRSLVEWECEL